ncbi:sigma-70 family RNA polymerase sigma factor [Rhodocytophaga aerolata]|uniref:Sigma-70 family RNA polymerase sigma factor n=1 Tax=Rhodocytophaga aerolata TaxID=455078 RepID=A0ABT8RDR4_9BACT|nr:sigma-70 family RNA polymerase sigma factor [Rhodocytophaga aerolata]MDO1449353.1 sigma-70 family RNA polymerase sigma factor [Rhodocytophaga aerolata]
MSLKVDRYSDRMLDSSDEKTPVNADPANGQKQMTTGQVEDVKLWQAFKKHDKHAFRLLYEKYAKVLYNYGRHISGDDNLTKDCLQDLFTELWNSRQRLSDIDSVKHYLFKAFRRKILEAIKQQRKFAWTADEHIPVDFEIELSLESQLISSQMKAEQQEKIQQALNQLTKRQKEVIFLKFYQNLSYTDIASTLSLTVNAVYNLISKAFHVLKEALKGQAFLGLLLLACS